MLKKTITYVDYNDEEQKEDFYFNLTKAEITEMELSTNGGLATTIRSLVSAKNTPEIIKIFKELILKAYGEKTPDGKRFMKSEEISHNFACSPAYSELFMELATNDEKAAAFINGIIPKDLAEELKKEQAQGNLIDLNK